MSAYPSLLDRKYNLHSVSERKHNLHSVSERKYNLHLIAYIHRVHKSSSTKVKQLASRNSHQYLLSLCLLGLLLLRLSQSLY
jgi:hypothetical protein